MQPNLSTLTRNYRRLPCTLLIWKTLAESTMIQYRNQASDTHGHFIEHLVTVGALCNSFDGKVIAISKVTSSWVHSQPTQECAPTNNMMIFICRKELVLLYHPGRTVIIQLILSHIRINGNKLTDTLLKARTELTSPKAILPLTSARWIVNSAVWH